jgi:hypothetical protein
VRGKRYRAPQSAQIEPRKDDNDHGGAELRPVDTSLVKFNPE